MSDAQRRERSEAVVGVVMEGCSIIIDSFSFTVSFSFLLRLAGDGCKVHDLPLLLCLEYLGHGLFNLVNEADGSRQKDSFSRMTDVIPRQIIVRGPQES